MSEENVQTLKQAYAAFEQGDIPSLLNQYADDADWVYPSVEGLPYAGQRQGRDQIAQFFEELAAVEETTHFERREFIAQGDHVVATGSYQGRVKASGQTWGTEFVHVATVRDGQIQSFALYFDTAAAAAAYRG